MGPGVKLVETGSLNITKKMTSDLLHLLINKENEEGSKRLSFDFVNL